MSRIEVNVKQAACQRLNCEEPAVGVVHLGGLMWCPVCLPHFLDLVRLVPSYELLTF